MLRSIIALKQLTATALWAGVMAGTSVHAQSQPKTLPLTLAPVEPVVWRSASPAAPAQAIVPVTLPVTVLGASPLTVSPASSTAQPLPQGPPIPNAVQPSPIPAANVPGVVGLDDLIRLGLERNPRLAQAAFAIDAAAGRALQAGLYPNPTLVVSGDELGDRTGPGGIWTAPQFNQEIVTKNKLGLSRTAALREVDQATLGLLRERYILFTNIRTGYFEVLAAQRRIEILEQVAGLARQSIEVTEKVRKVGRATDLDLLQLQIEADRIQADLAATRRERTAAFRRLTSTVGAPDLPETPVTGSLEVALPDFDFEAVRKQVIANHPELRSAQVGVERAQLLLRRAQVEPYPNVTVSAGYTRQNQNKSSDWMLGVSIPLPTWNRNQGNIRTAQAELGDAVQQVRRVEYDLINRIATAHGIYAAARERVERYRKLVENAQEANRLTLKSFQGGQFDFLRVLQAQRVVADATLELNRSLGDLWRAISELAGLTMQEQLALPANAAVRPDMNQKLPVPREMPKNP